MMVGKSGGFFQPGEWVLCTWLCLTLCIVLSRALRSCVILFALGVTAFIDADKQCAGHGSR